MSNIFLDSDIILDVFAKREPFYMSVTKMDRKNIS